MFYEPRPAEKPNGLPYNPFKALVVPRPIGWISSLTPEGTVNLAPYSYFNAVSTDPPIVMFASNHATAEDRRKDSHRNIELTGEFVCNMATYALRSQVKTTSQRVAPDIDEMAMAGLTPAPSKTVKPPRVAESPIHLECRYVQTVPLLSWDDSYGNAIVIGEVVGVHIDDDLIKEGMVDISAVKPLARLGYLDYSAVEAVFPVD